MRLTVPGVGVVDRARSRLVTPGAATVVARDRRRRGRRDRRDRGGGRASSLGRATAREDATTEEQRARAREEAGTAGSSRHIEA